MNQLETSEQEEDELQGIDDPIAFMISRINYLSEMIKQGEQFLSSVSIS